jgi:L-aminopeptidase/D-esterase-like protein
MIRPGPRNLITDVPGILVGNAEDSRGLSGVTVVLPQRPALASVDVRGGAPGTRETDLLRPSCHVDRIDAICLSGGSAFGLDAASGVAAWLAAAGRGYPVRGFNVPIVPAAIIFDLANGGDKSWGGDKAQGGEPPYRRLGHDAAAHASGKFRLGNAGAGLGAIAGKLKGGLGSASAVADDGLAVGAVVAANPAGSVVAPGGGLWAAYLEQGDEFGGAVKHRPPATLDMDLPADSKLAGHTTIGVVATNARLDKGECERVAIMAQDGIARAVRPAHTPFDGDTIFVIATGDHEMNEARPLAVARIGHLGADCVARAIVRAVVHAETLGGTLGYRDAAAR